ncbi:Uncharacterized conserved protein YdcH, DUF465 family [Albimonas donghaensis]|uniref:Uncharacterized conserved protein YdcH, DUF465 family n=2 Tax=Albimonas donghaensis TaxID=356660 RepID=A0A1H2QTT3_9RHOB|nr:Uncharacterized conserved protein YdcH, DUF465 family [Albimonas donghaensis]
MPETARAGRRSAPAASALVAASRNGGARNGRADRPLVDAQKDKAMSHTPHELAEALPGEAANISARKASDPHFARLAEEYHTLNREIHRGETNVEPMDDLRLETLKKKRLALLDEIKGMLAAA